MPRYSEHSFETLRTKRRLRARIFLGYARLCSLTVPAQKSLCLIVSLVATAIVTTPFTAAIQLNIRCNPNYSISCLFCLLFIQGYGSGWEYTSNEHSTSSSSNKGKKSNLSWFTPSDMMVILFAFTSHHTSEGNCSMYSTTFTADRLYAGSFHPVPCWSLRRNMTEGGIKSFSNASVMW